MKCLLDTNVISELVAKRPDRRVLRWIDALDPNGAYLSVLTVGEVHRGIERLPGSKKKDALREWLRGELLVRFDGRILPIDLGAVFAWGDLVARLDREGRPLPAIDSLVAAVAMHNDCHLATRNVDDFLRAGVKVVNPWD